MVSAVDTPQAARHVATISLQRIVAESAEGRAANQQLQALAQKVTGEVAAKQKELGQRTPSADENRQAELQRVIQQSQAEYTNAQRELQTAMRAKLTPIVSTIATARHIDVVLNADVAVVWAASAVDITPQVLTQLNAAPPK